MALCGDNHKKLIDRLNRIEGQIRGIRKMVDDDRSCMEVLKQLAAASGAVRGVGMAVLENHLKGCVSGALRGAQENDELIQQVMEVFKKFAR